MPRRNPPPTRLLVRLALRFARDLVPAFTERRAAGRRAKFDTIGRAYLVITMDRTIRPDRMHGTKWAAKELVKNEPWRTLIGGRNKGSALLRQYHTSKKDPQVMRTVRAYRNMDAATAAQWECEAAANLEAKKRR
jgi:hypothetical protein